VDVCSRAKVREVIELLRQQYVPQAALAMPDAGRIYAKDQPPHIVRVNNSRPSVSVNRSQKTSSRDDQLYGGGLIECMVTSQCCINDPLDNAMM